MSAEFGGLLFTGLGVVVLIYIAVRSERLTRLSQPRVEREKALMARISELESTVATLLAKLNEAQRQIDDLLLKLREAVTRIKELESVYEPDIHRAARNQRPAKPLLLAQCNQLFGTDDAQAIRRTNIPFQRLTNCTAFRFDRYLQAGREDGTFPWWVQISAHMGIEGVEFADGIKTKDWLSQRVNGVRVLVLAGCENEEIGAQLVGLAKHVVVIYEAIESQNAQDFSYAFWRAVGENYDAADAFAQALQACPQVSEFVQMRTARALR
jgi:hypothetical protein